MKELDHSDSLEAKNKGGDSLAHCLNEWNYSVQDVQVSRSVISLLKQWWLSESSLLWVQEPFEQPNRLSRIRPAIVTLAIELRVPVGFYSCKSGFDEMGQEISHKQGLLDLIQGLSHIIWKCYPTLKDALSVAEGIIQTQPVASRDMPRPIIDANISYLQRQIEQIGGALIFIVDRINVLDYSGETEVEDGLEKFLKLLYPFQRDSSGRPLKTLLTTPGQTLFLLERIGFEDKIDATEVFVGDHESLLAGICHEAKLI